MKIREREWKTCGDCGHRTMVRDETYGCDECGTPMTFGLTPDGERHNYLEATIFRHSGNSDSEHLHFCSWKCVLTKLPTVETDYFITLPYLQYDEATLGQSAKDFFALLRGGKR